MSVRKVILQLSLISVCASGQTASGPVLGWAFATGAQEGTTLLGVPGAGRLGHSTSLPPGLKIGSLNPAAGLAAALDSASGIPLIFNFETSARTTLEAARADPDLLMWSPLGKALALYYREQQWAQVFVRRAGGFQLAREFRTTADSLAVSDSGSSVLVLSGGQLLVNRDSGAGILAQEDISGFTFVADSEMPAYWTGGNLVRSDLVVPFPKDASESVMLASPSPGMLLAVRSTSGSITFLDDAARIIEQAGCECTIAGLEPIGRAGAVRLVTADGGPIWIASDREPRLYFVPRPPVTERIHERKTVR
jgi:hypothetical protein